MKKLIFIISLFFVSQSYAQSPELFNYQAVVRDASGNVITNKAVQFKIGIYEGSSTGTLRYEETIIDTTSSLGMVSFQIGSGTITNGSMGLINWAKKANIVKVEIDPAGGGSFELLSTTRLVSVPYAMHAETVTNKDDADADSTNEIQMLSISNDTIFLSDGGMAVLPANSINNDNDSTNEIQLLSTSNDTLFLSNGGGLVTFTSLITWEWNGNDIYFETGKVGIGHDSPEQPLHVFDSIIHSVSANYRNGILIESNVTNSANANYAGLYSEVKGSAADNLALDGTSDGVSTGTNYGIGGYANNGSKNIGVEAFAYGTGKINTGLDGFAWNGTENYGVKGFVRANSNSADKHLGVYAEVEAKNGLGTALWAKSTGTRTGKAIYAESNNDSLNIGIDAYARSSSTNNQFQYGILGTAEGTSGTAGTGTHIGVYGRAYGGGFYSLGLVGFAQGNSTTAFASSRGVEGTAASTNMYANQGVYGYAGTAKSGSGYNAGLVGVANKHTNINYGVLTFVQANGNNNYGIANFSYGTNTGSKKNIGSYNWVANADTNIGVLISATTSGKQNYGLHSTASGAAGSLAGYFVGDVTVTGKLTVNGALSKGSGTFKIDHPLDPENKYLIHSFVESPDMMNVYNGNITTDANGFATVTMPDYVQAANKEFRYQITPIGQFAQCIIKEEMNGNKFVIQTDKPNVKVSWQVTGIRNDAYAKQNRIVAEVEKEENNKGKYLHPKAFGKGNDKSIFTTIEVETQEEVDELAKSGKNSNSEKELKSEIDKDGEKEKSEVEEEKTHRKEK